MSLSDLMCSVLIAKTRENLFVVTEVLILSQKEGFGEFFCASNGSKRGDDSSSSGSSSSSSSSGLSSDSSSSYSDEGKMKEVPEVINQLGRDEVNMAKSLVNLEMGPHLGTGTSKMDESDDDVSIITHKPILNPYPKVEDDIVVNDEDYKGLEYPIMLNCHCELYTKFPLMKNTFGKFAVSMSLFWCYNLY